MLTCRIALGAAAALLILGPVAVGADDPPPYASATDAYRQGVSTIKAGKVAAALPALEYAAKHGVLGAEIKLAHIYAAGRDGVPEDDAKAYTYYRAIADQYADISPSNPVAPFVGEAFVALGQYHLDGIAAMPLPANPAYAADLFRHAASYFGNADAQYDLALLYLKGEGVEKDVGLAVNWLAMAAKKQHVAAQATLGELLWRGTEVRQREARGLALITLAHENARAAGKEPKWIADLYAEAFAKSDAATRKEASALLPELGGGAVADAASAVAAKPASPIVLPAVGSAGKPVAPAAAAAAKSADTVPLGKPGAPPAAPIGLSVGFSGQGSDAQGLKP
ncbi:tetratricopeptide repeat protein [Methyloceanibacter sp.]|uniref:tetratricopeptide repeat protein n=1 Tax=Methyloceanibacter sp. TaxID=1965321 RepID=UPI002D45A731|nr:tetratricopeptide repeat protein [Methyloceanibacter sp.]HZP09200.1 tetratricopeptide repeat protein [Methyloceanibacter sp.]